MIQPLGNKVLIKPDPKQDATQGGIIIANPKPVDTGTILAIAPAIEKDPWRFGIDPENPLKKGDRVQFNMGGIEIPDGVLMSVELLNYKL